MDDGCVPCWMRERVKRRLCALLDGRELNDDSCRNDWVGEMWTTAVLLGWKTAALLIG